MAGRPTARDRPKMDATSLPPSHLDSVWRTWCSKDIGRLSPVQRPHGRPSRQEPSMIARERAMQTNSQVFGSWSNVVATKEQRAARRYKVRTLPNTMMREVQRSREGAAVVTTEEVATPWTQKLHFNTYGGNPMASSVGLAVLETIESEGRCVR